MEIYLGFLVVFEFLVWKGITLMTPPVATGEHRINQARFSPCLISSQKGTKDFVDLRDVMVARAGSDEHGCPKQRAEGSYDNQWPDLERETERWQLVEQLSSRALWKSMAVRDGIAADLHLVLQQVFSKNSYRLRREPRQFGWVGSQKCLAILRCSIIRLLYIVTGYVQLYFERHFDPAVMQTREVNTAAKLRNISCVECAHA